MHANTRITRRRRRAFTLIELLVVMTVISILAGMLFVGVSRARRGANISASKMVVAQVGTAIAQFKTDKEHLPGSSALSAVTLCNKLGSMIKNKGQFVVKTSFDLDGDGTNDGMLVDGWGRPIIYVRRVPDDVPSDEDDPDAGTGHQTDPNNDKIAPLHNSKEYDLFSAGYLADRLIRAPKLTDQSDLRAYQSGALQVSGREYTHDGEKLGKETNKYYGNW